VESRTHHQKWVTRWHSGLVGIEKKKVFRMVMVA
jgi:hypothetical protein